MDFHNWFEKSTPHLCLCGVFDVSSDRYPPAKDFFHDKPQQLQKLPEVPALSGSPMVYDNPSQRLKVDVQLTQILSPCNNLVTDGSVKHGHGEYGVVIMRNGSTEERTGNVSGHSNTINSFRAESVGP